MHFPAGLHGQRWFLVAACSISMLVCAAASAADAPDTSTFKGRQQAFFDSFVGRPLKQGHNPATWVDTERWCVAHAALHANTRLDEANQYLSEVQWVSLSHGLIADTDVQVTDLIRTWFEFHSSDRLSADAKAHLEKLFKEWDSPNKDRNRDAREAYTWPHTYTENHSFSIVTAGYLIDVALERDRAKSRELLQAFMHDRAKYGWAEFYSTRYGMVTSKTLTLLIDFAPDKAVRDTAHMLMDIIAIDYASHGLHWWRGIASNRGASNVGNNSANAIKNLARLWFGDPHDRGNYNADPMLLHFLTSGYEPPVVAVEIMANLDKRPAFFGTQTATTAPPKDRVPIAIWATPVATMTAVQGFGSFYQGSFVSVSFASSPGHVIYSYYGREFNNFQHRNVLCTFGTVTWKGGLKVVKEADPKIATDGKAWVAQISLADDCHVLMLGEASDYADAAAFEAAVAKLDAKLKDGVVSWTSPDGAKVEMVNQAVGGKWQFQHANVDGELARIDKNMLYDSPFMRSVRGSGYCEVLYQGVKRIYDLRDADDPRMAISTRGGSKPDTFKPLPQTRLEGPLEGMELLYIPPGEFPMGAPLSEGRANERPMRWVDVDGFYMSKYEVTIGQWKAYLEANPDAARLPEWYWKEWGVKWGRRWRDEDKVDDFSVTYVSWREANDFCLWLSHKTGDTYRLPTEAEWEKAAKGYEHRAYPWGNRYDGTQAGSDNETYLPVGSMPLDRSVFGVMDTSGNTWEWCSDWYAPDAYATASTDNPTGPDEGTARVVRSCGWNFDPDTFRITYRTAYKPDGREVHIGFRVVREIKP